MTHFSFISTYIEPFMGIILLAVLLYGLTSGAGFLFITRYTAIYNQEGEASCQT